jgi:hypothetical protein
MAEWKKVVVSGSAISQLQNDSGYLKSGDSSVVLSGSFEGDGSNLSGITADTLGNSLTDGNGISDFTFDGSGAASVAVQADGSTLSVGASGVKVSDGGIRATQIHGTVAGDGLSGGGGTALSVNTDTTSIAISSSVLTLAGTTFSSSVDSRIDAAQSLATTNSASLAALDTDFATDAQLSSLSGSAHAQRVALDSAQTSANNSLSSSIATALRAEYVAGDSALSASAHTQRVALDSSIASEQSTQDGRLDALETFTGSLDASFATDAELSALSSSAHTARGTVASDAASANNSLSSSIATALRAEYVAGDSALSSSAATALRAEYVAADSALSASAHTARGVVASNASSANSTLSASIATTTDALDGRVDSLETDSHTHANKSNLDAINQDLGTGDNVNFNNVVVDGDLTVAGTTTTLNTTNLLVEDKFILLNSGSADPDEGGLIIDEGAGSGHAFIYDKGDTRWGFNASVAQDASTANATAHAAAVVDMQNVAHSDSAEYQKNGNIKIDDGDIFIYC